MKKLILFRHAKSSWDDSTISDHDRPLAEKGIKTAPIMGKFAKKEKLIPDKIICSTAVRARQTLDLFIKTAGIKVETEYNECIYSQDKTKIIKIIQSQEDALRSIMIVGHNPDLEELVEYFTGETFPYPKFSTAGIAVLEFNVDSWKKVEEKKGKLVIFKSPKMLKNVKNKNKREE